MTLNVTGNQISIKNTAGQTKFTSENKLIWEKYYQTGVVSLTTSNCSDYSVPVNETQWASVKGFQLNDFALINLKILSSTGNTVLTTSLVNKELPANGTIVVDFTASLVGEYPAANIQMLSVELSQTTLNFRVIRFDYTQTMLPGNIAMTIEYKMRLWSYL
jgi:hypothetical protein